jgi:hypothetical protein
MKFTKLLLIIYSFILCVGCSTPIPQNVVNPYIGEWSVRYLPDGKEAQDYIMDSQPLPPSDNELNPFGRILQISEKDDGLLLDFGIQQHADIFKVDNSSKQCSYIMGRKESEFGIETFIITPANDGNLYGFWSRVFWGLNFDIPPWIGYVRFVLEKKQKE